MNPKIGYAVMMSVRTWICSELPRQLAKLLTISVRYSVFRRQFRSGNEEQVILDYPNQQEKLFTGLAESLVQVGSGHWIWYLYDKMIEEINESQDFSRLQEVHCLLSGCKAFQTDEIVKQMEIARLACGGHGFLMASGFGEIIRTFRQFSTVEGENTVMFLQLAKFLLKTQGEVFKGKSAKGYTVEYLNQESPRGLDLSSLVGQPRLVIELLKANARELVTRTTLKFGKFIGEGNSKARIPIISIKK